MTLRAVSTACPHSKQTTQNRKIIFLDALVTHEKLREKYKSNTFFTPRFKSRLRTITSTFAIEKSKQRVGVVVNKKKAQHVTSKGSEIRNVQIAQVGVSYRHQLPSSTNEDLGSQGYKENHYAQGPGTCESSKDRKHPHASSSVILHPQTSLKSFHIPLAALHIPAAVPVAGHHIGGECHSETRVRYRLGSGSPAGSFGRLAFGKLRDGADGGSSSRWLRRRRGRR